MKTRDQRPATDVVINGIMWQRLFGLFFVSYSPD